MEGVKLDEGHSIVGCVIDIWLIDEYRYRAQVSGELPSNRSRPVQIQTYFSWHVSYDLHPKAL